MDPVCIKMESMIAKIFSSLFREIPNGVTLIFAIGTLIACAFILLKKRHHAPFYLCFWVLVTFMVLWRAVVGIITARYTILLVFPAVMLTAFTGLRGESYWRLLCRKYSFLPRWFAKFISRAVLVGTSAGALLMAHHALSANQTIYVEIISTVREYKKVNPALMVLIDHRDGPKVKYYTGANVIGAESAAAKDILTSLKSGQLRNKDVLIVLSSSDDNTFSIKPGDFPEGKKLFLIKKISPRKKRKGVNIYLYSNVTPEQMTTKSK